MNTIVVGTTPGREAWLADCLHSLRDALDYQILVLSDFSWELGKIRWIMEHTTLEEFFFLHDSCVVKDVALFDRAFAIKGSVALTDVPVPFGMSIGKFTRATLNLLEIPVIHTKMEAVNAEVTFHGCYCAKEKPLILYPGFGKSEVFREKHGRRNMVCENHTIIKYKGTWDPTMAEET